MSEYTLVPPDNSTLDLGRDAKPLRNAVLTGKYGDPNGKGATADEMQQAFEHKGVEGNPHGLVIDADTTVEVITNPDESITLKATSVLTNGAIEFRSENGTNVLLTGAKAHVIVPYSGEITAWELTADIPGSIEVDIWKGTYADYPLNATQSIVAGNYPALISAIKATGVVAGWDVAIAAGNYIQLNIRSVSSIRKVTLTLKVTKK